MGQLEAALPFVQRARERAAFMAKKFALNQIFRDGGAIHLDERRAGARAGAIERAGDQFFARAALALDQYGGLRMRHLADELAQIFHGRTLAEQFATGILIILREVAV